ncbi:MAG: cobalamin biosynthesis protein [Desulfuromonadales bacterium]|nr:cobalamin biosynthesis protein [Desulfuromonadales bacterium]
MKIAIVAITHRGAELARQLGEELLEARVYLPTRFYHEDSCDYFSEPLAELLPRLFARTEQLVCVMATGIVVRLLAGHLRGKEFDPGVVVLDEAGNFAISLLSGHLGGANRMAQELAEILGGQAVITTATDVNNLPAWDQVARDAGMGIQPVAHLRTLNRLLLEGETIALVDRKRLIANRFLDVPGVELYDSFADAIHSDAPGRVFVTNRYLPNMENRTALLAIRPPDLVLGLGCNRGTSADEIEAVVKSCLPQAFLAFASIGLVATIDAKRDEAGINEFAERHKLQVVHFPAEQLNRVEVPSPPSAHALEAVGAKGVCEPAAVLGARGGPLLIRKQKSGNVTLAVAEIKDFKGL